MACDGQMKGPVSLLSKDLLRLENSAATYAVTDLITPVDCVALRAFWYHTVKFLSCKFQYIYYYSKLKEDEWNDFCNFDGKLN